jgi:hypothetical protein
MVPNPGDIVIYCGVHTGEFRYKVIVIEGSSAAEFWGQLEVIKSVFYSAGTIQSYRFSKASVKILKGNLVNAIYG